VVAHPDDEILWFSSIISQVSEVIVCFLAQPSHPKVTEGRRAVLANYALTTVSTLGIEEADVYDRGRWPDAEPSPIGVELGGTGSHTANRRYRENFTRLTEELGRRLAGFDTVFTHNPWGEYGHEEHVQVYRAVRSVQTRLGFALWCSAYTGSRSHGLMARCLDGVGIESITLDTDIPFARDVAARYKEHGAWTWFDDYAWPARESFLRLTAAGRGVAPPAVAPLSYLSMGLPRGALADRSLRSLARKAGRYLPRASRDPVNPI
jgi:LmbE family N-acetylglucosaminyl deacetylase